MIQTYTKLIESYILEYTEFTICFGWVILRIRNSEKKSTGNLFIWNSNFVQLIRIIN